VGVIQGRKLAEKGVKRAPVLITVALTSGSDEGRQDGTGGQQLNMLTVDLNVTAFLRHRYLLMDVGPVH
jgi:hypothetical protein